MTAGQENEVESEMMLQNAPMRDQRSERHAMRK